jgi:uncharacterized Zn-finger protein
LPDYDPPAPKTPGPNVTKQPIPPTEIVEVDETRVACDGDGGALGHPKIYLEMGTEDFVECGYCDRRFVLSKHAREARERGEAAPH